MSFIYSLTNQHYVGEVSEMVGKGENIDVEEYYL